MSAILRLSIAIWAWCCTAVLATSRAQAIDFEAEVLPVLQSQCVRCHGPLVQEGNLRLDTLSIDLSNDRAATENWQDVLNALDKGEMPPEGEPPLNSEHRTILTTWISSAIKEALAARRNTDGRVVARRLNRVEYQNTMEDLLGLEMDYARDLPPDAVSADGFENDGRALQMSPIQLEYYLDAARRALERVIVSGEKPKPLDHTFTESKIDTWLGTAERSNRLGRQQEFLAKIVDDYPDEGDFLVRVKLSADIKSNIGFPLLSVSVGYQPDTEILLDDFELVEVSTPGSQMFEFRGRMENFPRPVRGQGKFPGLVIRIRNLYDDSSPKPAAQKDAADKTVYPDEPLLPTLTIESVEFHGNAYEQWPPPRHRRILFDAPENASGNLTEPDPYVREVLRRFMARAFRRAVEDSEVDRMFAFFKTIRADFPSFEEAFRETLAMVLIQPDFLYRLEPSGDEKRQVTDIELASRISYFLWSTMPDDRLLELALAGKLREPETLAAEVDRLLTDQRSSRFINAFTDQWLSLNLIDNVSVNRDRYPGFDDKLKIAMCGESRALIGELIRDNLSAMHLLQSDFTMLNEPLAKHYGINGIFGIGFRRVSVPTENHRGGLLSQASVMLLNSTGSDSHPVRRAVWIRDRLLNDPPPPPPPNVPTLKDADPKFHELSIREQLELHRANESCNRCHRNIDPWGIALENYDALGIWRTELQRKTGDDTSKQLIDASSALPGGQTIQGAEGLKQHLASERKRQFATSLVSRLFTYALGRSMELSDQESIEKLVDEFAADDYRMRNLIQKIVGSDLFLTK